MPFAIEGEYVAAPYSCGMADAPHITIAGLTVRDHSERFLPDELRMERSERGNVMLGGGSASGQIVPALLAFADDKVSGGVDTLIIHEQPIEDVKAVFDDLGYDSVFPELVSKRPPLILRYARFAARPSLDQIDELLKSDDPEYYVILLACS
jgi:hypothetical protein